MQAIILRRRDYREHDQIISVYSKERGRISAMARGVKKITSKNSAYLEPFFYVEAEIIPGREIPHLTKATGLNPYRNIRNNLHKSLTARQAAYLMDELIAENEPDVRLFNLFKEWLDYMEDNTFNNAYFYGFLARLYDLLGYRPVLDKCVLCRKETPSNATKLFFSFSDGGLSCTNCRRKSGDKFIVLQQEDLIFWKDFLNKEMSHWPQNLSDNLGEAIINFIQFNTDKKLAKISQI